MERMSTLDAGFFFVEHENVPMHLGSLAVFEGPAPAYEDLSQLFADDAKRGERFAVEDVGIYLDYSKNRITDETLKLLLQLAEQSDLRGRLGGATTLPSASSPPAFLVPFLMRGDPAVGCPGTTG